MDISARAGRDDDDVPVALPLHRRQRGMDRIEDPKNVDVDHLAIFSSRSVLERSGDPHPRDIEQEIQTPLFLQDEIDRRRGMVLVCNISLSLKCVAAGLTYAF